MDYKGYTGLTSQQMLSMGLTGEQDFRRPTVGTMPYHRPMFTSSPQLPAFCPWTDPGTTGTACWWVAPHRHSVPVQVPPLVNACGIHEERYYMLTRVGYLSDAVLKSSCNETMCKALR